MYRLRSEWSANNGLSAYPDNTNYVYFTRTDPFVRSALGGPPNEILPNGKLISPCLAFNKSHPDGPLSAFQLIYQTSLTCLSAKTPDLQGGIEPGILAPGQIGQELDVFLPVFLAAIDPVQEDRLVGFEDSLASGRGLTPSDRPEVQVGANGAAYRSIPVMTSAKTYVDETLHITIDRLRLPAASTLYKLLGSDRDAWHFVRHLPTQRVVGTRTIPIHAIYRRFLRRISLPTSRVTESTFGTYWRSSATAYRPSSDDRLSAVPTGSNEDAFFGHLGFGWAPKENADTQYRTLTVVRTTSAANDGEVPYPLLHVIGRFDPMKLPGFSRLSQVPLEAYYPPEVLPADEASRAALGHRPLLPTANLGGYIAQPPLMLTTLQGLRALTNPRVFQGAEPQAPISVIRIRVAGVTGPDAVSRERIRAVAQAIHDRTGLAVDITAGSSPHPMLIDLPAGRFGQPPLTVREGWVQKGVAVSFLDAIDRKSVVLFGLILVICAFFLANGTLASVRSRRGEIGTLLCLGWSERAIFRAVLSEVAVVGLVAGVLGSGVAAVLVPALGLQMPLARTLLALPIAILLALASGLLPAWRAARAVPMDAVRPAVSERGLHHHLRRVLGVAVANLARVPSRTALGAAGLAIGVAALTILLALNRAFHGVLVGTLLGNALSVQVRKVDLTAVAFTIALGGMSVLDVLFLNVRERAPELVTLRTVGWRESDLRLLIVAEGVGIGALGCIVGAIIGSLGASFVRGVPIATIAASAGISAAAGVAVAALASLVPLALIERLTPPTVLAEE